jgi:hypothetical protein
VSPDFQCGDPIPKAIDLNTRRVPTFPWASPQFDPVLAADGADRPEDDEDVIQMNEVRICASAWVQRAAASFTPMIDEPGHPTGHFEDPRRTPPC